MVTIYSSRLWLLAACASLGLVAVLPGQPLPGQNPGPGKNKGTMPRTPEEYLQATPKLRVYVAMTPNKRPFDTSPMKRPPSTSKKSDDLESLVNPLSRNPDRDRAVLSDVKLNIESWFRRVDLNGDGFVHELELAKAFRGKNAKPYLLKRIDKLRAEGKNIDLSYGELSTLTPSDDQVKEYYPETQFLRNWDDNGDRSISPGELRRYIYHVGAHVKDNLTQLDRIEAIQKALLSRLLSLARRKAYLDERVAAERLLTEIRARFEWQWHIQKMQQRSETFRWLQYTHVTTR